MAMSEAAQAVVDRALKNSSLDMALRFNPDVVSRAAEELSLEGSPDGTTLHFLREHRRVSISSNRYLSFTRTVTIRPDGLEARVSWAPPDLKSQFPELEAELMEKVAERMGIPTSEQVVQLSEELVRPCLPGFVSFSDPQKAESLGIKVEALVLTKREFEEHHGLVLEPTSEICASDGSGYINSGMLG